MPRQPLNQPRTPQSRVPRRLVSIRGRSPSSRPTYSQQWESQDPHNSKKTESALAPHTGGLVLQLRGKKTTSGFGNSGILTKNKVMSRFTSMDRGRCRGPRIVLGRFPTRRAPASRLPRRPADPTAAGLARGSQRGFPHI